MISCMAKALPLVLLAVLLVPLADAHSACPIMMVSGTGDHDGITVTFRNRGKLPIRRLEFNCAPLRGSANESPANKSPASKAQRAHCSEQNVSFIPGAEYTVSYSYPNGKPGQLQLSVRSVTFSDGNIFKPSKRDPCRELKIIPLVARQVNRHDKPSN